MIIRSITTFLIFNTFTFISSCQSESKINTRLLQANDNQSPINFLHDFSLYTHLSDLYISKTSYENLTNPIIYRYPDKKKYATKDLSLGNITLNSNGTEYIYKANEIKFYCPSEHKIENQDAQMEMQIIHTLDSNAAIDDPLIQKTLIISLFFLEFESLTNEFIRSFINFRDENNDTDLVHSIDEDEVAYNVTNHSIANLNKIVQKNKMFYYYEGSHTIDPYERNVSWMVMNYFYYFSDKQSAQLQKLIMGNQTTGNNRPVQENSNPVYLLYNKTISINMVFTTATTLTYGLANKWVISLLMLMII